MTWLQRQPKQQQVRASAEPVLKKHTHRAAISCPAYESGTGSTIITTELFSLRIEQGRVQCTTHCY